MNQIAQLISSAKQQGIFLWVDGDKLRFKAPKDALNPELKQTLSECKAEIIAFLQQEANFSTHIADETRFPLSYGQQALWFVYQEAPDSPAYNMALALHITSGLNRTALQCALHEVVKRHTQLHTRIEIDSDGIVWQQVTKAWPELALIDASHWTWEQLLEQARQSTQQPFDLTQSGLRVVWFEQSSHSHLLVLTLHHIFGDARSLGIIQQEWLTLYEADIQGQPATLASLPATYADYVRYEAERLKSPQGQQLAEYWHQQLSGGIPVLNLPTDHPRPPMQTFNGASYPFQLPQTLSAQLVALAQRQKTSLFTLLLGAFQVLLYRYTGQTDIWVGTPTSAGRLRDEFSQLVGYFVNPVVLRTQLTEQGLNFEQLLHQLHPKVIGALAHQAYPFPYLVQQLQPQRNTSTSPLFQTLFSWHSRNGGSEITLGRLSFTPVHLPQMESQFDLTLTMTEGVAFDCVFNYNRDLFDADRIQRMTQHLTQLLEGIVAQPERNIDEYPLLTLAEIQQLRAWNQTQTDYPKDQTIVSLFEEQVAKTPDNVAVVFEGESLSYQQLNAKANQLAHYLLHPTLKNCHNPLIAISLERSLEMVIGLLGILKAGAAYVPIDPNYPAERIAYLLSDSAAPLVVTQSGLKNQLPVTELEVVCVDEADFASQPADNPSRQSQSDDLAYVIYTSGSTGQPKGVMVEHHALNLHLQAMLQIYPVRAEDRVLQFASMGFDTSLEQLWVAWLRGAGSVLVKDNVIAAHDLVSLLQTEAVSIADLPPAYWQQMLAIESDLAEALPALQTLILGGEALPLELARQTRERFPTLTGFNAYGPTEAVITPTVYRWPASLDEPGAYVSIGQPRANTKVFILDNQHQVQPLGVAGELCVVGEGLARGYLNRPELTEEKFVEIEVFGEIHRVYKTGDLARWRSTGDLEYLGRIDNQVKLRGFRIELGEIEAVLLQHERVKQAAVVLRETEENKHLVAYVSTDAVAEGLVAQLQAGLKKQLPDYMVPAVIMVLETLPLTPNGKVDREALPAPESRVRSDQPVRPRNEVERQLASIWSDVLNRDEISIHDNFFGLGGDSILSLQVVARARQIGLQLTPRTLFEHQTLAELASAVGSEVESEVKKDAEQGLVSGEVPLTPIQRWFFAMDFPEYWHFNQSILLKAPLDLSVEALQQAFAAILRQHDALHLRYALEGGTCQQYLAERSDQLPLSIEDLRESTDPSAALLHRTEYYQTHLNLQEGPLTRLVLFKLRDSVRVFWCVHHLAVDGVSWRILLEDLYTAYNQAAAGQAIQLPNKTSSFKAWAQRLSAYAGSEAVQSELSYWQSLPVQQLPVDKPDGQNRLEYTQQYAIQWDAELTHALLHETYSVYNLHINDILLTALALALQEWTGHAQCVIDLETHGRVDLFKEIDLSRTVGWFTSIYPLSLTLPIEDDLGATLKAVQAQRQSIPNEGLGHSLLSYLCGEFLPRGNLLFNYLGQFDQNADNGYFSFATETTGIPMSQQGHRDHLIEINGMVSQGQLHFIWSFGSDCYHASTIETLANHYQRHLHNLILHCQTRELQSKAALLLRQGCAASTLFCVPGLGSKAGYFHPLAQQLQTIHTIYGLESPGLEGRDPIPETVEALAQQHLEVIRHLQPTGPYYLFGHSFGAVVVLEIAWQLEQVGETVALTAVVDQPTLRCTPTASRPLHTTEFDWLWRVVGTFQRLTEIEPPFDLYQLKQTGNLQAACERVMIWLKQHEMHELLFSSEGRTEELLAYVKVHQANETAFLGYHASDKTLLNTIDLFYTEDSKTAWDKHDKLPDDWGWGAHAAKVRIHPLSGAHFSVFKRPHVQDFAKRLEVQLHHNTDSKPNEMRYDDAK